MRQSATYFEISSGRFIAQIFGVESEIQVNAQEGWGWIEGFHDAKTHYAPEGVSIPRPSLPLPATHTLPAGADWTIPDVPDGTRVIDTPGGEMGVADGGLIRTWLEPGEYDMRLDPPFPWVPATCRVTVT